MRKPTTPGMVCCICAAPATHACDLVAVEPPAIRGQQAVFGFCDAHDLLEAVSVPLYDNLIAILTKDQGNPVTPPSPKLELDGRVIGEIPAHRAAG